MRLRRTDRSDRRRVHDPLDLRGEGLLEDDLRPLHVELEHRVTSSGVHRGRPGEVEDALHPFHRATHRPPVGDVAIHALRREVREVVEI